MIDKRISKCEYYLKIAKAVSARSTCLRRKYGAVIVKNDRIISTGYNGSVAGDINCCDRGTCERQRLGIPQGKDYSLCNSIHAENNACLFAGREATKGATLYLYGFDVEKNEEVEKPEPCDMCHRVIVNMGIKKVVSSFNRIKEGAKH